MWGKGILTGMRITMRNMLRGPITVKYPYEKLEIPERARWAVAPIFDEQGAPKCTACMACVRACPDHILDLEFTTREDKSKHIECYSYEIGACMMCGLCVEACPFDAIEMSHDYELARLDPAELTYDLLADVDAAPVKRARPAAEPKTDAAPAEPASTEAAPAELSREEASDE
ncbi:MAG: NuoI/complex I 23 kDa subunit family protein [Anaerosomatales bacterium]